jgi:hypothetical protein
VLEDFDHLLGREQDRPVVDGVDILRENDEIRLDRRLVDVALYRWRGKRRWRSVKLRSADRRSKTRTDPARGLIVVVALLVVDGVLVLAVRVEHVDRHLGLVLLFLLDVGHRVLERGQGREG